MRLVAAVLYLSAFGAANAALADTAAIAALQAGDMDKLVVLDAPIAAPDIAFLAEDGSEVTLAAFAGQITVVNFWATWCAPCREEMPTLSGLEAALGGEDFAVITVATGRNDPAAMDRFLTEVGADNLPQYRDPRQALARAMGVLGLPVTVILDRDGQEIARLIGDADWNSESARAIMAALIAG